jgi:photosystem II stability/assembly factor-like uncharacterized protein
MKASFYSALFFLLIVSNLFSQDWFWLNPLPQGNSLTYTKAFPNNVVIAVGSASTVVRSTNGGVDWTVLHSLWPFDIVLSAFYFCSSEIGYGVGSDGAIYKTTNGGLNWQSQISGTTNDLKVVYFIDQHVGWAAGQFGTLLKTTNGGNSWFSLSSGASIDIDALFFLNENIGWFQDEGTIISPSGGFTYLTSNGGQSWTRLDQNIGSSLTSLMFINSTTGWGTCMKGAIYRTDDGGITWVKQYENNRPSPQLNCIFFLNESIGWAVGEYNEILKTTNGGLNWESIPSNTSSGFRSIFFLDANIGYAVGYGGKIVKTNDGGNTWIEKSSEISLKNYRSIFFTDQNNGIVVGRLTNILKTTNSGSSWSSNSISASLELESVHFINGQTGWIAGYDGVILKTTNGGTDWANHNLELPETLHSIFFSDENNGWVVGWDGAIYKSTDGGINWFTQNSRTLYTLHSLFFTSNLKGWAVGGSGTITNTENGGAIWTLQPTPTTEHLQSVFFINETTGWAVGQNGTILKTTNGGSTWIQQNSGTTLPLICVRFWDSLLGYAVGERGIILRTTDGGNNWVLNRSPNGNILMSISLPAKNIAYAVGLWGTIIKTNNSVETYTISVNSNPTSGGVATGSGTYAEGSPATVSATPNTGYTFQNWTEGTVIVSTNISYTFTVNGNRNLTANFNPIQYTITTSSNPVNGGTTSGGGLYNYSSTATVSASPNSGYEFSNWTENGNVVSSNNNYGFTVSGNRALIANFVLKKFTITISANPPDGGTVNGGGLFDFGQSISVLATPKSGYSFSNWTENGNVVSTSATYTFSVNGNRILIANFLIIPALSVTPQIRNVPSTQGATNFTVSNSTGGTMNWSSSSDAGWAQITNGINGVNSGTIEINYQANSGIARIATITVTSTGAIGSPATVQVQQEQYTDVETFGDEMPKDYALQQNYPNPFNPQTIIRYDLPRSSFVRITIFNLLGLEVKLLVNEEKGTGKHNIYWNSTDNSGKKVSSGVYFYTITADNFTQTKKMVLMK